MAGPFCSASKSPDEPARAAQSTAYLLTERFDRMGAIAVASSVFACVLGTYLSYHVNTATGRAIVVALTLQCVLAYGWSRWRGTADRSPKPDQVLAATRA